MRDDADHVEILDVLNRFMLAVDTRDYSSMRACLTDKVAFDYSAIGVQMPQDADSLVDLVRRRHAGFQYVQHMTTNHVISVDGDVANVRTNFVARHVRHNEGDRVSWTIGGRYRYVLIRTGEGWRLSACEILPGWSEGGNRS